MRERCKFFVNVVSDYCKNFPVHAKIFSPENRTVKEVIIVNRIIVSKFGGSSMSEASYVIRSAQIVKSNPMRRYVVVSAPGKSSGHELGITDMLYLCHSQYHSGENPVAMLERVRTCFAGIVEELGIGYSVDGAIASLCEDLSSGKSAAYMASRGEYIMAGIFAKYIGWEMKTRAR